MNKKETGNEDSSRVAGVAHDGGLRLETSMAAVRVRGGERGERHCQVGTKRVAHWCQMWAENEVCH